MDEYDIDICDKCGDLFNVDDSGWVSINNFKGDYWSFQICGGCIRELVYYIAPDALEKSG
jgi:hypothetical protein